MYFINPEKVWANIEGYMIKIYQGRDVSKIQFIDLHTSIFNYCTERHQLTGSTIFQQEDDKPAGEKLYNHFRNFLKKYSIYLLDITVEIHDEELLNFYTQQWKGYELSSRALNNFCNYFNCNWIGKQLANYTENVYKIYDLAIVTWREDFFQNIHNELGKAVLKLIDRDRNGETINYRLLSGTIRSFIDLGYDETYLEDPGQYLQIYKKYFEDIFIEDTRRFFQKESAEFLRSNPVTEYMKKVEQRLNEEKTRADVYLHYSTADILLVACEEVLLQNHLKIFEAEFQNLLNNDRTSDLKRMYSLLSRLPNGLTELKIIYENHIHNFGIAAIEKISGASSDHDPKIYFETLCNVHNKFKMLVTSAFHDDIEFLTAAEKGCSQFINKNPITVAAKCSSKSPELIAKYCDMLLKKSNNNEYEEELEDKLFDVRIIFQFIEDKDIFQKFYTKMLARRLVLQNSTSDDAEAYMISKLKAVCGSEYTNTLQKMLQDISISKDLNKNYQAHLEQNPGTSTMDFSILVLCGGIWPLNHNCSFHVPSLLESSVQRFNSFYSAKHSGRKLKWMYNLSKVEIVTNCFRKRYTIQASAIQLGVLHQFNDQLSLTVIQLQESTGLARDILIQILQILLKSKLVNCAEDENNLKDDSIINLFLEYKNKKFRININLPLKTEKKTVQDDTMKYVEQERKSLMEAAIVRIMKHRKTVDHKTLVAEVLHQLAPRFIAKVPDIKKAIEILIQKDYIEKASGQKNKYNYLS